MLVAIRTYELDGAKCTDRLERIDEHAFRLTLGDVPTWRGETVDLCELAAHRWLRECREQLTYRRVM